MEGVEKEAMQNLTLIPEAGVPLPLFEKWTETDDSAILGTLIRAGLIQTTCRNDVQYYAYLVSLKPVIRELVCDELEPSFQSCEKLIHNTSEAMGLLLDSADDLYLMKVAQEVIRWAKMDNIPVYIHYLHKSFALAARNGQKDDMQNIADALAEVLEETDCGTNCDRALMQDYQAQVRDIPSQAIAFRKSAIDQLNLDVPAEKKLAAIILDRIANNYVEENNWHTARCYSDLSWSYFRELGLLEQTDTFPVACRRG